MKKKLIGILLSLAMALTLFAGITGLSAKAVVADDNTVVFDNDGETKITDAKYDKYFEGTAAEGVEALLNAGKCTINGLAIPKSEEGDPTFQINEVDSLWKTDKGWNYNVHKYTGAGNDTFQKARKELFDMTSTVRGHKTTITLDADGKAAAIDIESFEVCKIVYFEDHGGNVDQLNRGEFELETKRVRKDINTITAIESKNWDSNIKFGDVICYWNGADGWHAVKAGSYQGVLTSPEKAVYEVASKNFKSIESNVSRYNLIDDTRPTQGYTAYTRMGLQDAGIEIICWVTPNGYPIGFSYGDNAKAALAKAIENAEALVASVKESADGTDVPSGEKWATKAAIDEFNKAIADAKAVNAKNSSANWDREKALYALNLAWGEGGDKPSGFVGEIGEGTGAAAPADGLFPDVTEEKVGKTANAAINWAAGEGIVKGFADGTFQPEGTCTREQFVVMIWRFAGKPAATAEVNFSDVTADRNTYKAIQWAVEQGIIKGFDDGSFQPEGTTTRRQVAIMLWRMAGKNKASVNVEFTDVRDTEAGFDAIQWGAEAGLIKGYNDGSFKPEGNCERQHIAIFLYRYNNNIK